MNIKALTYNIRCDAKIDGINCFDGRKWLIRKFLQRECFDIIGFQEVHPHMKRYLECILDGYEIFGTGRLADYSSEGVPLAYRKDKFELLYFNQLWLSDTPEVPGSVFADSDQSKYPRVCSVVKLLCKEDGKVFTFANTHLDHLGKDARARSARLLIERFSQSDNPLIITGDFNATPDEEAIKLLASHDGFTDLTQSLGKGFATYHEYGKITENYKIDYIFAKDFSSFSNLTVHKDTRDGIYLSDHYPISVSIEI